MSDQKSYRIGLSSTVIGGTGTLTATTTALTGGGGSAFATELYPGAVIIAAGQTLAISAVKDNDEATLQTAPTTPLAGASFSIAPMTLLTSLTVPVTHPKSNWRPWQEKIILGNGLARGVGRPSVSWQWGFITQGQYDQLKSFCSGASARVLIYTRTTETADSYKAYTAAVLWPDELDRQTTRRVNFTLEFTDLVLL